MQKSALIQKRTSPLKFGDLAEKSELNSVSNFSTKAGAALSEKIRATRKRLRLDEVLGCSPRAAPRGPLLDALYLEQVVPTAIFAGGAASGRRLALVDSSDGLRYPAKTLVAGF